MIANVLGTALVLTAPVSAPDTFRFSNDVANLEVFKGSLLAAAPRMVTAPPPAGGALWYGTILRRLPGDDLHDGSHFVPFAAEYSLGSPVRAWCDVNGNGDLEDDPPPRLNVHPGPRGARSFLATLAWTARTDAREVPVESIVRVVLEPQGSPDAGPTYRVQRVHAPMGEVTLAGRPHRAILFDADGDGLYRREFPDGFFVDLDDDLHFDVDPMSPGFAPFGAPFRMGGERYEVTSVDPQGREMSCRNLGQAEETAQAAVGAAAPDFVYEDLEGRRSRLSDYRGRLVLLYFWASWCGGCGDQAPELASLYRRYHTRGVELLGVSYDTDRSAMSAFREAHRQSWPTSFSGHGFWEDPIGKLYRARRTGEIFLIDREGRLDGTFSLVERLSARLEELTTAPGAAPGSAR